MQRPREEILERLEAAIAGWKSEVMAAQKLLTGQILAVAGELESVAETLSDRQDHAARLTVALEEVERLKEALDEAGMPAGAITRYSVGMAATAEAIQQDMRATAERLETLIAARVSELTGAHERLTRHVREAAGQLDALLAVLASRRDVPSSQDTTEATSLEPLLRQSQETIAVLRAQKADLETQLETLNTELEHFHAEEDTRAGTRDGLAQELGQALADIHAYIGVVKQRDEERARTVRALLAGLRESWAARDDGAAAAQDARATIAAQQQAIEERNEAMASLEEQIRALEEEQGALRSGRQTADAALAEAQAALEAQETALDEHGRAVAELREKDAAQQQEMQRTAAERDAALRERDEAREALWAVNEAQGRAYVGRVGGGLDSEAYAAEVAARNEQMQVLLAGMALGSEKHPLGELLVRAGLLTEEQLHETLKQQRRAPDKLFGEIVAELEYATEEAVAQAVACQLDLPLLRPTGATVEADAAALLNREVCTWHGCIPIQKRGEKLVVAMTNPLDETALRKIRDVSHCDICPVVATRSDVVSAVDDVYGIF